MRQNTRGLRGALPPAETYHALVRRYSKGVLKPPFNDEGRAAAFSAVFYAPLAAD